ncbi:GDNF family receptor alpha-2-like, partial [Notechis scutatus]|uniref:GDNF family receptor alpha-2-like n=1 Tax=Notechis scutatus TaxID=8663 RepID=A0A6J1W3Z8_9SAUR
MKLILRIFGLSLKVLDLLDDQEPPKQLRRVPPCPPLFGTAVGRLFAGAAWPSIRRSRDAARAAQEGAASARQRLRETEAPPTLRRETARPAMARAGLLGLLLALGRVLQAWAGLSLPATPDGHGWQSPMDCARANVLCASEPGCSSSFRTLRQCLAGRDHNTLLGNKECRLALEVLQGSALHGCRCRRRMKRELPCLQIYWSLHLGSAGGEELYEASPYEPIRSPPSSDAFRLASIVS